MLLLQESIYGESIAPVTFDLSDLKRSMSRSLILRRLISHKGAELLHMLPLNVSRKGYFYLENVLWYLSFMLVNSVTTFSAQLNACVFLFQT